MMSRSARGSAARWRASCVAIAHRAPEGRRGWLIEEINGKPAVEHPSSQFLIEAGFAATAMGLQFACRGAAEAAERDEERRCLRATRSSARRGSLHRVLAGHVVTRFETAYAHLDRVNVDTPIVGRTIEQCESAGKHL